MRTGIGIMILCMVLAAGLLIPSAGGIVAAAEDLQTVAADTFDDEAGNSTLKNWTYPSSGTVTVAPRPKDGETEVFELGNQALKSTIRTTGSAHRVVRKFAPLSGKLEISYEIRLEGKPVSQIKLPEIDGGGTLLTSISVIPSIIDAESFFRFDIPTGPSTRIRPDGMPFKTWIPVKVEMDTAADVFSVWIRGEKVVDGMPFYNNTKTDAVDELRFALTKTEASPDFYLDNLVVKGTPAPALNVRGVKLAAPPAVPVAAHIRKQHPRIFIDDFSKIRTKIAGDYIPMNWYNGVKRQADVLLDTPVRPFGTNPDSGQVLEHAREMENRTFILSMAYQMERERKYLDRLWLEIQNTTAYPTWMPESFLSVAEMLQAYAIAYDWNYYDWTEEQRAAILNAMLDKGLTYGVDRYNGKSQGGTNFTAVTHNWNVVCNGGLMIAALAIADEYPDLSEFVLEKGTENIKKGLTAYAPLGAYPEGAMYWSYGTSYLTYTMSAFDTAFASSFSWPSKYKLYEAPGVASAPDFPVYLGGMTGSFNYGDSSIAKVNAPLMMWFAEKFDKPQYAWYFLRNQQFQEGGGAVARGTVYSLLWYDSEYRTFTGSFPLDKAYQNPTGTNSVLMRSSWQDNQGIYAGLKGGYNRENHSSLSIGTFILEASGQRWATMRGAGNYDWDGYNDLTGGRFQYYNNRAEGQNTLVVNPAKGGFDQMIEATGIVEAYGFNSREAFGVMDMSQAYARDAQSAKRGMKLFDNRSKVLVQDEISAAEPAEVWWFMHTAAAVAITDGGKSAMLTQNGQRLWAHIAAGPEDAVFQVMDAKPLPWSPNPSVQSSNYGAKLAIRMKDVTGARLAVQFNPLKPGEAPPASYEPVVSLAEWRVETDDVKLLGEKMGDSTALLAESPFAYDGGARVMAEENNPAVRPMMEDGSLLVPVSFVAESLGAQVTYDETANADVIRYKDRLVLLPAEESEEPENPDPDGDNTLNGLTVKPGSLEFDPALVHYKLSVDHFVSSITVTATAASGKHKALQINGASVPSGTPYAVALEVGLNTVAIGVTAENGAQRTYTLEIIRAAEPGNTTDPEANPGTNPETKDGSLSVVPGEGSVVLAAGGSIAVKPAVSADGTAAARITTEIMLGAVSRAAPDEQGGRIVLVEVAGDPRASSYRTELPSDMTEEAGKKLAVAVKTPVAAVTLPGSLLSRGLSGADSSLVLAIEAAVPGKLDIASAAAIGNRPGVRIGLSLEGRPVRGNTTVPGIAVSIPYTPAAHEMAGLERLTVWRLAPDGSILPVPSAQYDQAAGAVNFAVHELDGSIYSIAYVSKTFRDTAGYGWAEKPVQALASRGIIGGVSETAFAPGEPIARADFLLLLVRALELRAEADGSFADVADGAYYAEAVGIARKLGIADGMEGNRFLPEAAISRQDIFTLAARAMTLAGKLNKPAVPSEAALARFSDSASLALYARESAALLAEAGIIQGDANGLRPQDSMTRAEAAVLLYQILAK